MSVRRRGKVPNYRRRPRDEKLPELLANCREARRQVLIARGHLIAHLRAEEQAVERAWDAGATHQELAEAAGQYHVGPGYVAPALRRVRRG